MVHVGLIYTITLLYCDTPAYLVKSGIRMVSC